nr:hypothetical protein BaRGS_010515 [Batillaria attramentaria]
MLYHSATPDPRQRGKKTSVMSGTSLLPRPGLFIGGLRRDLHPARLAGLISSLIWKFQVSCPRQNVHIAINKSSAYALVDLPDEESKTHLLSQLSDISNILNVFDLNTITNNPYDFHAKPRWDENAKRKRSKSRARKNRKRQAGGNEDGQAAAPQEEFSLESLYNDDDAGSAWFQKVGGSAGVGADKSETSLPPLRGSATQQNSSTKLSGRGRQPGSGVQGVNSAGQNVSQSATPQSVPQRQTLQMASMDSLRPAALSDHGLLNSTQKSAATSTTGLPAPVRVSTTTSTPGTSAGLALGFYRLGEVVGRESRHSEFKAGGMTQKERGWLQETVGKYVCGFLNSAEGGTLFVGVNDAGRVIGFPCSQALEDDYRLLIDEALKSIEPSIFPDRYRVRFVPVMEESGHLSDHLQVLEVQVHPTHSLKHLYDFRGHAYIRRDGSLQGPLKARHVQEWTRKQLEREHYDSLQLRTELHEMTLQLDAERRKNKEMREKLEDQRSEVPLKKKKSRVCNVM